MKKAHPYLKTQALAATAFLTVTGLMLNLSSCKSVSKGDAAAEAHLEWKNIPAIAMGAERSLASVTGEYKGEAGDNDYEKTAYLNQNWSPEERELFYRTPQGSHIMPLKFALVLEKANSEERFLSNKNLAAYGFITQMKNPQTNPYGLPVGFTVDGRMQFSVMKGRSIENGERYLGINCAVCHTSNLSYQGRTVRIDGGQTLASFQNFVRDLDVALKVTREDQAKLDRFLGRVMAIDRTGGSSDRAKLIEQLDKALQVRGNWSNLNDPQHHYGAGFNETKFAYGPGRIDAFAAIFNEVLARDLGVPGNSAEPNAPVSPPVIWDAPHHDFVQWNGLASNDPNNGGPLARNIGQVLGVFGQIDLKSNTKMLHGYCSTARRDNLEKLEEWVKDLNSPLWPEEILGQLDKAKIAQGKKLFEQSCAGCHISINRADPNRTIKARLIPMSVVGTETKFNDNALARVAQTAHLKGRLTRLKAGRPLEGQEPSATVLRHTVAGAIAGSISLITCKDNIDITSGDALDRWKKVTWKAITSKSAAQDDDSPDSQKRVKALVKKLAVYKARPLNGIWSSPPFLHNGSVKSLYDLMLPASERKSFYLGCNEYDPVHAGLNCGPGEGRFLFDTSINGNTPVGHDFGPRGPNAEDERLAIIEYLKSL